MAGCVVGTQAAEKQRKEESERFKEQYQKFVETQKAQHAKLLADKRRVARMVKHKASFQQNVESERRKRFVDNKAAQVGDQALERQLVADRRTALLACRTSAS